jgi:hypothetical protein
MQAITKSLTILALLTCTSACVEDDDLLLDSPPSQEPHPPAPRELAFEDDGDQQALVEIRELETNPDIDPDEQPTLGCSASMACLKTADGYDWGCLVSVSGDCGPGPISTRWSYSGQGVVWYPSATNARVTLPLNCNPNIANLLRFEVRNALAGTITSTSRYLSCPVGGGML